MLKRFYSKRSGFTLVEIIIAFAIFAVMASMVGQILDLSVKARLSNIEYQNKLKGQQQMANVIVKKRSDFSEIDGRLNMDFNGTTAQLSLDRMSTVLNGDDADGLNYYLANVDYEMLTEADFGGGGGGDSSGGSPTGSQMDRMDTRITGTANISNIIISRVVKDTNTYASNDPLAIPAGCTRYYFEVSASSGMPRTLKYEDVPYSQYRLYFYQMPDPANPGDKSYLEKKEGSDESGSYIEEVHKEAVIAGWGYLKDSSSFNNAISGGLKESHRSSGTTSNNKYSIAQTSSNTIRIGSPFIEYDANSGYANRGIYFETGDTTKFYVDFVGDPHLTVDSFGNNGVPQGSGYKYTACPAYADEDITISEKYNSDGTPTYVYSYIHVNVYGAYMNKRNYN